MRRSHLVLNCMFFFCMGLELRPASPVFPPGFWSSFAFTALAHGLLFAGIGARFSRYFFSVYGNRILLFCAWYGLYLLFAWAVTSFGSITLLGALRWPLVLLLSWIFGMLVDESLHFAGAFLPAIRKPLTDPGSANLFTLIVKVMMLGSILHGLRPMPTSSPELDWAIDLIGASQAYGAFVGLAATENLRGFDALRQPADGV